MNCISLNMKICHSPLSKVLLVAGQSKKKMRWATHVMRMQFRGFHMMKKIYIQQKETLVNQDQFMKEAVWKSRTT